MKRISFRLVGSDPLIGALGASAWVVASDAPETIRRFAQERQDAGYPAWLCDGVADDVQIQAAINALPAAGGVIVLSEGDFTTAATINVNVSNVTIRGAGRQATTLTLATGANCSMFTLAASKDHIWLEHMYLGGNKANQSGTSHGITTSADRVYLRNLQIDSFLTNGIIANGSNGVNRRGVVEFVYINACTDHNIVVSQYAHDWYFWQTESGNAGSGKHGFYLNSTDCNLIECSGYTNGASGVLLGTAALSTRILGGIYNNNEQHGIVANIRANSRHVIDGAWIFENSQETTDTYDGIHFDNGVDQAVIVNCRFGQTSSDHKYNILAGDSDNCVICNNDVSTGYTTASISVAGTGNLIQNNPGYTDPENRLTWAPIREAVLAILGSTGTIIPIGDSQHEATDRTTCTTVGEIQAVFTYSEAVTGFATPPTSLGPGRIPIVTFNGTDEEADTPDAAYWTRGNGINDSAFSIGIWANIVDSAAGRAILAKDAANQREWTFHVGDNDKLRIFAFDGTDASKFWWRESDAAITMGSWVFLVVTYAGTGGATAANDCIFYSNGGVLASTVNNDASYVAMNDKTSTPFLGKNASDTIFFNGKMAGGPLGPFFVQAELSADAIKRLYQLGRTAIGV